MHGNEDGKRQAKLRKTSVSCLLLICGISVLLIYANKIFKDKGKKILSVGNP
jgi:hypothetical protein